MSPEIISPVATLGWVARYKAISQRKNQYAADLFLAASHVPEQVRRVCKAAIGAGTTTSNTLGTPFEGIVIGPFSDAMRTPSAFFRILSDNSFTRIPMHRRVGMVISAPSAGVVAEGAAIPLSQVVINNLVLSPIKAAGLIALSDELLFAVDAGGQAMFSRQLSSVLAAAVDTAFVNAIGTGTTPITSTNPTKDVRSALQQGNLAGIARPYWIGAQDVGKFASTLSTYLYAFAAASAVGGELANLPFLVSSGVPSGTLYLVDGSGIAADALSPTIDVSSQADLEMNTAPTSSSATPTAASMVSMFGTNSTAVKAVAVFGAAKLRSDAVAVVTGITGTTWTA
jgi:hypothetical protein